MSVFVPARPRLSSNCRSGPVARLQQLLRKPRRLALMEGISLWLAVLLMLSMQSVVAEASETPSEGTTGELRFVGASQSATLLATEYEVTVSGLIADTELRQRFENTSPDWQEAVYTFPLPARASVYSLTLRAGERVIEGRIQPRETARKQYQQARDEGRQAARVDQQRPNLFTTRLANIPPGEAVSVEIRYQQAVSYQSGQFELRLPTTLTPRYMPGAPLARGQEWHGGWARPTTAVPDADAISPMTVRPADVGPGSHHARIQLTLNAGLPIASVSSPGHALVSTWDGDTVSVTPQDGAIAMDRDLVVRWSPVRGETPSAAVFHERWQGEDYLLTLLVPGVAGKPPLPRELVFVIDTSGSMAGASIGQARSALLAGLDTLTADDRFNVIQFSSSTRQLFTSPVAASPANLDRARHYVRQLNADGGTEMAPALTAALAAADESEPQPARVRQVVFITDGAVGNEVALFAQIQRQLGQRRLFTVAIGSAPNMHFMREAARFGRGTYTAIGHQADLAAPLAELFGKMRSPVLTDLTGNWTEAGPAEAYPARPGDLFAGEPLVQIIRGRPAEGEAVLTGQMAGGEPWQAQLALAQAAPGKGLHRFWAREKINSLLDRQVTEASNESVESQVTELGLKHQLVTPYTSFVALDTTPARAPGQPLAASAVPTLLPSGSTTEMLRYPQTATPAPLLMLLGLPGLLTGLVLLWRRRLS